MRISLCLLFAVFSVVSMSPRFEHTHSIISDLKHQVYDLHIFCGSCKATVGLIQKGLSSHIFDSVVMNVFVTVCELVGVPSRDCLGLRDFVQIVKESIVTSWFDPDLRCWQHDLCDSEKYEWLHDEDAIKRIISDKPPVNRPTISENPETLKVLQISDIHFDPKYEANAVVDCKDILCCRDNSIGELNSIVSGEYGAIGKCDLPFKTVISFLDEVLLNKDEHPDLIIWTGDNPQHSIWDITEEQVPKNALNVTRLIKERYEYKGQVIPVWGNHGVVPNDQFDVFHGKDSGVKKQLADAWHDFIGEDAFNSFNQAGYYMVKLDPKLGLKGRVIVLNSMLHDTINFFLIQDQTDPHGQVRCRVNQTAFLEEQLKEAEEDGEFVYIVGHIPPGDGYSLDPFNKRYTALIDRYTNIIRGQFYGHTHDDQFKMTQSYALKGEQSGVQFIVPSLTTFSFRNPSYRIYDVDKKTGFVVDFTQYRMYLSKGETTWKTAYTMRQFFGVKDGSDYKGFQKFAEMMKTDQTVFDKMMEMFASQGPTTWAPKYMKILSCQFQYSVFHDSLTCADTFTWESTMYVYWLLQNVVYTGWYRLKQ